MIVTSAQAPSVGIGCVLATGGGGGGAAVPPMNFPKANGALLAPKAMVAITVLVAALITETDELKLFAT